MSKLLGGLLICVLVVALASAAAAKPVTLSDGELSGIVAADGQGGGQGSGTDIVGDDGVGVDENDGDLGAVGNDGVGIGDNDGEIVAVGDDGKASMDNSVDNSVNTETEVKVEKKIEDSFNTDNSINTETKTETKIEDSFNKQETEIKVEKKVEIDNSDNRKLILKDDCQQYTKAINLINSVGGDVGAGTNILVVSSQNGASGAATCDDAKASIGGSSLTQIVANFSHVSIGGGHEGGPH